MPRAEHTPTFEIRHYQEMGRNIRALRMIRKLTQEELAEETDLSARTIKRIEAGESITLQNIMTLCLALNCTLIEIMPHEYLRYVSPMLRDIYMVS